MEYTESEKKHNKKFIESYKVSDLQVETPNGWIDIEAIGKTIEFDEYKIITASGRSLICADKHILYKVTSLDFFTKKCDISETYCEYLSVDDIIMTIDGPEPIVSMDMTGNKSHMYDLQISNGSDQQYYTNGILSHNSLWMQNFACRASDMGKNVLYITLEMSERKVMKRLGSMRLKIPINDYDNISKDHDFMRKKLAGIGKMKSGGDLFENKIGKVFVKFWAAGTVNITDFDNYIDKLQQRQGLKIDLIIVDYITLLAPLKGAGESLYIKGKHLAEGLRSLGSKYLAPVITGVQVAKDAWNSADITLESVPESKAIAETADTFFCIIRTEEMKRLNLYRFKLLKQRDGDFLKAQIKLNLNPTFLTLEDDQFID